MPYTLLQALGYVVQDETLQWERIFSPPNSPRYPIMIKISKSKKAATSYVNRSCLLRLTRRDGVAKRSLLVFNRGPKYHPACGTACVTRDRGITGCKVCGTFVNMWLDELEKAVPGLKAEEKKEEALGEVESDSGYSSMCES